MSELSHLDELEAEAIYIIREVAAECEKPVMLYSIGKDSSVMLHLAMKAFYPEKPPFQFMHIDTTWKFKDMIKFRDDTAKKLGIDMIVYTNEEGVKRHLTSTVLQLPLVVVEEMKKNLVQKKEFSHSEMKTMLGTLRTSVQKCGSYTTLKLKKVKVCVYSLFLTGQKRISGST